MIFVESYSPLGLPKLFIGGKVSVANLTPGFGGGLEQDATAFFQAADIGVTIIGFFVPPTNEINAHEFEGQGPPSVV